LGTGVRRHTIPQGNRGFVVSPQELGEPGRDANKRLQCRLMTEEDGKRNDEPVK